MLTCWEDGGACCCCCCAAGGLGLLVEAVMFEAFAAAGGGDMLLEAGRTGLGGCAALGEGAAGGYAGDGNGRVNCSGG